MKYYCPHTQNDKWLVEFFFNQMRDGFFIEAGGADGVTESSSYVLEKEFGWKGIILEPGVDFYEKLSKIRTSVCLNAAFSDTDGTAEFITSTDKFLSGIDGRISEWHKEKVYGDGHSRHVVKTITINTLLSEYNCPSVIDYIHLDIEGSEMMVVKDFPFDRYLVKLFIIEMSDGLVRWTLLKNGFIEVKNQFNTESPWECYFVNKKIIATHLRSY
jgi:FkbM family methyltransferase